MNSGDDDDVVDDGDSGDDNDDDYDVIVKVMRTIENLGFASKMFNRALLSKCLVSVE